MKGRVFLMHHPRLRVISTGAWQKAESGGISKATKDIPGHIYIHKCKFQIKIFERYKIRLMRVSLPEHIKNHERPKNEIIQIRGPGNSAFLIELMPSKDVYETRFLLKNFILVKYNCRYEEPGITQFERHGYVMTKPIEDYQEMTKKAMFHVKEIGAEEVVEDRKTKRLKFICSPGRIFVTAYKLSLYGYEMEYSGIEYYPKYLVGLKKNAKALCQRFLKVMNQLPNVVGIYDNIKREL